MRVLMTGGGTGGHVNPALAIARTIKQNDENAVIAYVGTERGIENKLVGRVGYPMYHVEVKGIKRSLSPSNIKAAYLALTSPHKAKKIIREFSPDIVIGTGGYVCWPVVKAAADMGIPTALHESNAIAGVAVKMLVGHVDRIWLNFEKTAESINRKYESKLLHVGNPVSSGFRSVSKEEAREKLGIAGKYEKMILSYGGSLGAEKVNDAALEVMKRYSSRHPETLHVHATGSIEHEICTGLFKEAGLDGYPNIELLEFIYDMPLRMAAADLVICRAGAMTVSELAMSRSCAIFIPSPNVAENHQYKNAKVLEDAGAAFLFEERDLAEKPELLTDTVEALLSDEGADDMRSMREKISAFATPDANKLIYEDILKLLKK
ncbi:MAG: undecaprenyldiphospho-muramoylpentapeptide beta-N-acetylglucosaminyltransferase [Clostridia bacterium]|nr:undecaprenyldiphospho-muramoylpentapeptide beta-N-acetylglucosaminyltransferase [Clostridia bacterium]